MNKRKNYYSLMRKQHSSQMEEDEPINLPPIIQPKNLNYVQYGVSVDSIYDTTFVDKYPKLKPSEIRNLPVNYNRNYKSVFLLFLKQFGFEQDDFTNNDDRVEYMVYLTNIEKYLGTPSQFYATHNRLRIILVSQKFASEIEKRTTVMNGRKIEYKKDLISINSVSKQSVNAWRQDNYMANNQVMLKQHQIAPQNDMINYRALVQYPRKGSV